LAVLENRDLAAAAQENRGAYEQAQANYETTTRASVPEEVQKAELDLKASKERVEAEQKVYDSRKILYEQGALPRKDFDQAAVSLTQARNQYEIAQKHLQALESVGRQAELRAAAAQLESAKGRYLGAEAQVNYSEIRSPIDGVVTDRPLYEGEMAAAGSPLITVMDTSQVIAKAHISQQQTGLLKVGDVASLYPPGPAGAADKSGDVQGRVTVLSPALDANSTTVEIWIQAPNPGGRLKPGTTVRASILAQTIPEALVIPASALLTAPDGSTTVMAVGSDGRAHQRVVKTGAREGGDVQIMEGLKAGESVVTVAAYGLPDNTRVEVETPGAKLAPPAGEP
jgi:RND family efflux transporter MFP subunit